MRLGKYYLVVFTVLFLLDNAPARAQFYLSGTESAKQEWSHILTDSYDVIYPKGLDSLGAVYARTLEMNKFAADNWKRRLPVVLHTDYCLSNGMVTWAPSRMELYTWPATSNADAIPWERQLAIHEGRHVHQMYSFMKPKYAWSYLLFGDLSYAALSIVLSEPALMEGDAVLAETAFTLSGRGRSASFLEYYRTCIHEGKNRSWDQWRWGSAKLHTPDYYKIGYVTVASEQAFGSNTSFGYTNSYLEDFWSRSDSLRAPFMPSRKISRTPRRYHSYVSITEGPKGYLYAIRQSDYGPYTLVRIGRKGREHVLGLVSASASALRYSSATGALYWSEFAPSRRFEMQSSSIIRCYSPGKGIHDFPMGDRLCNPAPHPQEDLVAAICYPREGGSAIVLSDGQTLPMPDGIQAVECCWQQDRLVVLTLSEEGFGIMDAQSGEYLFEPQPRRVFQLFCHKGELYFTSDMDGVNELYTLSGSRALRVSNLPLGAESFCFKDNNLYYAAPGVKDKLLYCTPQEDLPQMTEIHEADSTLFPFVGEYAQEMVQSNPRTLLEPQISEPLDYSKTTHPFRIHSWLPVYYVFNDINSISSDIIEEGLRAGVSLFYQNTLGTLYGGAAIGKDMAHADISYRGHYPVFQASIDYLEGKAKAEFRTFVPLNFSKGGWNRGVIPMVSLGTDGHFTALVRAYTTCMKPDLGIYPRYGIGLEAGIVNWAPAAYGYAYLPGLLEDQGWKLTGLFNASQHAYELSASYAIPCCFPGSINLAPYTYIRNWELIPHFTYTHLWDPNSGRSGSVHGIGASADVVLGNIFMFPYTTRVGAKVTYNIDFPKKPFMIEGIFSIDI